MKHISNIWSKISKYAVPGALGVIMVYAAASTPMAEQSDGAELTGETPDYTELAWTDDSNLLLTFWHVLSAAHTDVFVHAFAPLATQAEASRTQLAKTCHSQIRNRLENP